jgi:aryl carrier-like protein
MAEEERATTISRELTAIWSEVVGEPPKSDHTNFFASGGTSLAAMKLMARVRKRYGSHLRVRELYENPSIAALTDRVVQLRTEERMSGGA